MTPQATTDLVQFGMYIMFPIGIMYYFGTNLDSRFSVPDFWPKEGQTHRIPFEKEEITEELERLKERRLAARHRRLEMEKQDLDAAESVDVGKVVKGLDQAQMREGSWRWKGWSR